MRKLLLSMLLVCSASLIAACSSGGGGDTPTVPQPSSAVVKLSTAGSIPAGTTIIAYDVTMTLPDGVTVTSSSPPETDDGVVTASGTGSGSMIIATCSPATFSAPGSIRIRLASGAGMSAGEFCTITCNVEAGSSPAATDFYIQTFSARGLDTANSTVDLTTQISVSVSGL